MKSIRLNTNSIADFKEELISELFHLNNKLKSFESLESNRAIIEASIAQYMQLLSIDTSIILDQKQLENKLINLRQQLSTFEIREEQKKLTQFLILQLTRMQEAYLQEFEK